MPKPFICPRCGFDCELVPRHDCEPPTVADAQVTVTQATIRCEAVTQFAHHLMRKVDLLMAQGIKAEAEKICAEIQRRAHKRANLVRNQANNGDHDET